MLSAAPLDNEPLFLGESGTRVDRARKMFELVMSVDDEHAACRFAQLCIKTLLQDDSRIARSTNCRVELAGPSSTALADVGARETDVREAVRKAERRCRPGAGS